MDSLTWKHPTGNAPKTICLVCLGPSRNSYIGARFEDDLADAVIGVDEVWTLNRGVGVFSHDLCFVMDHIGGEADKFPRYGAALWNHNKPIITSDNCEGWPSHVHKYPFKLIWNWTIGAMNPMHGDWYHNSVAYILVYAAFIGVKEVRIFGADYSLHSSGVVEDGHPCVAYWVGKCEALGMKVIVPTDSGFLNINQRKWLYGYKDDPRTIPANRARFRSMVGLEQEKESVALMSGERQVATHLELIQPDHRYRYGWATLKASGTVIDLGAGIGYGSAMLAKNQSVESVFALERSEESLDFARAHYNDSKIVYHKADLDKRAFPLNMTADCAVAFELIEHLANPFALLSSIPASRLFASVPNQAVVPYSPEAAPFHHRHYTKQEFADLLAKTGWIVVSWHGQHGTESPVVPLDDKCRTLIVEAERVHG